ncbi:MAG: GNAT family N-acetyltransferase [Planctomycetota bacterium]
MSEQQTATATEFEIRPLTADDKPWVQRVLKRYWATTTQATRGHLHHADELPGFAAWRGEEELGLITYSIVGDACEIVTHNSLADDGGIGSCLLAEVRKAAREAGCRRLWLVTTNDNTPAIRFYQRREFDLLAVHRDAMVEARKLKPEIPELGLDSIRIRHEVELEYLL